MAQLGVTATCVCGKSVEGEPSADGTVKCGACGRRVVLDPAAAARALGTTDETRSVDSLRDSTGRPFAIRLGGDNEKPGDGVTQSVVSTQPTGAVTGVLAPRIPERLGCYRVLGRLGEGGMGVVYKGHDETLDRPVALKVLARTRGTEGAHSELEREARAIAAITHPNVVQVYAAGEQDGLAYFAMELVNGPDLREVLEREGPLPVARAKRYLLQAASGLRAAARKGIFHRDVKPANILLDSREDVVKVADFGLAKRACVDASMGGTSLIAGTPLYVAPEVIKEGAGDHRADIYSLGSAFFHLLAGQPPFGGKTAADALVGHATQEAPDLRSLRADVPAPLAALIRRCMEKDPARRPQSYDELMAALDGAAPTPSSPSTTALPILARPVSAPAPAITVERRPTLSPPVPPLPPSPPAPSRRPRAPGGSRWPFLVAIAALVLGGRSYLHQLERHRAAADSRDRAEHLQDCGFASFVHELTHVRELPGDLDAPTTARILPGLAQFGLPRRAADRCSESRLPYAVCGRSSPVLAWHVHDARARTVEFADSHGTIRTMGLYEFLRYLRFDTRFGRRSWDQVAPRLAPFLPDDAADNELERLDGDER